MSKNKTFRGGTMLLLASFFWGSTFIVQSDAAQKLSSFTYLAARSYVGSLALFVVILLRSLLRRIAAKRKGAEALEIDGRESCREYFGAKSWGGMLLGGACCGAAITVAGYLQQQGIFYGATAGEAGFLTALYMFVVPLFSFILYRKRGSLNLLFGAIFMAAGLYFICVFDAGWSKFGTGHWLIISCAVAYAVHIMVIDRFKHIDGLMLSAVQFAVCALISTVCALIFEQPSFPTIANAWFPILYAGICSSAVGFTLQIYGQKYASAALSTIFMSLESVIALVTEWLCAVTGIFIPAGGAVQMTGAKIGGCALAFLGILLAQLPLKELCGRCRAGLKKSE